MVKLQNYYLIGELAEICEISTITLRYYDKIGILKPDKICSKTNYRYYSKEKVLLILMIKYYKRLGFTLNEIKELLPRSDLIEMKRHFTDKLEEIQSDIQISLRKYQAVWEWNQLLTEGTSYLSSVFDSEIPEIKIIKIPKCKVVTAKFVVDTNQGYSDYNDVIINKHIVNTAEKYNLYCAGPVFLIYNNYVERIGENFKEIEIYVPIYRESSLPELIVNFGDVKAVSTIHIGKYSDINLTYLKLVKWCYENSIVLQGSAIEKYLIDPWSTDNEQNYVTRIFLPIN
ncbi:MerR family transcriptional regulator [Clostridium autoethanogenum]|uniref:MerR family transcriptional regulator n=1 Tax=Clostridium autoethanogenum TaxID=84023 RepID=A0A3M0SAJ6_9CLOT|nr:MerR family transcriptional regulator [Clostridium autoethanogenum]RMC95285.1 MerR family transcriptional regulator [Clostridium autoethanogenum]